MTDFGGKTSIFSHPVYLFLRKFSLQDSRGGSVLIERASNGEVTRQQLRPFDWMNIWPELEDTKMLTQPLSRSLIHENQA
ncbi:helix-turn-helix domain-containing protein [Escherichia coli]|uniref:helix-turn-helix domain-containing protein n=1 Tax=Escherichia coli TaxID=562 RepID=UPI0021671D24|nr:helix-turn-helix domain-containing protein [Escherichia coli]